MQARIERHPDRDQLESTQPPRPRAVNPALLATSLLSAAAAAAIAIYVSGHPFIAQDAAFERGVQAAGWGPLPLSFPVFSFIGDVKGAALEAVIFVAILVFNRRAWLLAAGLSLSAGWYVLISHLVLRARPTTAQVLRVTEHPGASSFPSGHTIFVVTIVAVLMLCLGRRYLPRWGQAIGWTIGVMLVLANGISRMYVGAHWPTDVLAAILISVAWICFCVSWRRVSEMAFSSRPARPPSVGSAAR